MRKIFCKEKTPRDGSAQMEFNNQNGGSFMNKLFKATLLSGIVVASVLLTSCSDGSNGKAGGQGQAGAACEAVPVKGGVEIQCGGVTKVTLHNGAAGIASTITGPAGEDCEARVIRDGRYEFYCNDEYMGYVSNGDDAQGGGGYGCLLENDDETLSITCGGGDNVFVMSLCNGQTYDSSRQFCEGGTSVVRLCNYEPYESATQYCARNLAMEVNRKIVLQGNNFVLQTTFADVDITKMESDNWMVLGQDSCFARSNAMDGATSIKLCTDFSTSGTTVVTFPGTDGSSYSLNKVCSDTDYFDLVTGKCITGDYGSNSTNCLTIVDKENTCYSNATVVPNEKAFVKGCKIANDSRSLYYDPKTVASCDGSKKTEELALTCNSDKYFSKHLFDGGLKGAKTFERISCVEAALPLACPEGSDRVESGSQVGSCAMKALSKVPVCPGDFVYGAAASADVFKVPYEEGIGEDPKDYCVKKLADTMCPGEAVIASDKSGWCSLAEDKAKIVPPSVTVNGEVARYVEYSSSAAFFPTTASERNTLCDAGGKYNFADANCEYDLNPTSNDAIKPVCPGTANIKLTSLYSSASYTQNTNVENVAYYCVQDITTTQCPVGWYVNVGGYCERKNASSSSNGVSVTVTEVVSPKDVGTCPKGLEFMYGDLTITAGNTLPAGHPLSSSSNTALAYQNTINLFPGYASDILGTYFHTTSIVYLPGTNVSSSSFSKIVCATQLRSVHCPNSIALYSSSSWQFSAGDYMKNAPTFSRVCAGNTYTARTCPAPDGVNTLPIDISSPSSPSCAIAYNGAGTGGTNGDVLCMSKGKSTTVGDEFLYDDGTGLCRLTSIIPDCGTKAGGDYEDYTAGTPVPSLYEKDPTQISFRACALKIDNQFCPLNKDFLDTTATSSLASSAVRLKFVSEYNFTDKECVFMQNKGNAICAEGFTFIPATGWCEGSPI
jgi:hypothetical protein